MKYKGILSIYKSQIRLEAFALLTFVLIVIMVMWHWIVLDHVNVVLLKINTFAKM